MKFSYPLVRAEPELLEVLGQLAHHVPGLALHPGVTAEQLLQCRKHSSHRTLGFDFIRERCNEPDFADELRLMKLAHVPARTVKEFPHWLEPRRELRVNIRRLAGRETITEFLEDGKGERLGAALVTSHTFRNFLMNGF
jgi:hypothetical protein